MTTVACDLNGMAADTFMSDGTYGSKIFRIGDALVGECGESFYCQVLISWFEGGQRGPAPAPESEDDKESRLLILRRSGITEINWRGIEVPVRAPFAAIGSGREFAMGVLHMKHTPVDAVETAALFDPNTKAPVEYVTLSRRAKK